MMSKASIRFVQSLRRKRQRNSSNKFIVEGDKMVKEFLASGWSVSHLFALPVWLEDLPADLKDQPARVHSVSDNDLKKISSLTTPNQALAVIEKPDIQIDWNELEQDISLLLINIQDPGNLGTILRVAAWFGIKNIFCSKETVDLYNPKVIQATMGALLHVKTHYVDSKKLLLEYSKRGLPVYGTYPQGEDLYTAPIDNRGIIIFGNESQGIPDEIKQFITREISIPGFGLHSKNIESLNVAVAASIICSEFRRREIR